MSFLVAFLIALLISSLFSAGHKKGEPLVPLVIFFLVLFMAALAAQFWIIPFGPVLWGVAWLPVLLFVIITALLLSARPLRYYNREVAQTAAAASATVSAFLWLLMFVFLVAIIAGLLKGVA